MAVPRTPFLPSSSRLPPPFLSPSSPFLPPALCKLFDIADLRYTRAQSPSHTQSLLYHSNLDLYGPTGTQFSKPEHRGPEPRGHTPPRHSMAGPCRFHDVNSLSLNSSSPWALPSHVKPENARNQATWLRYNLKNRYHLMVNSIQDCCNLTNRICYVNSSALANEHQSLLGPPVCLRRPRAPSSLPSSPTSPASLGSAIKKREKATSPKTSIASPLASPSRK